MDTVSVFRLCSIVYTSQLKSVILVITGVAYYLKDLILFPMVYYIGNIF